MLSCHLLLLHISYWSEHVFKKKYYDYFNIILGADFFFCSLVLKSMTIFAGGPISQSAGTVLTSTVYWPLFHNK